ncbi:hypothetical protein [Loigolactobacillus jiayinensis]|uniref:Cell surface protein n=1 Tax=Loigolactobacillus jiayinensis TaxID=2486016 RepID=A0ABW1RDF5_9LACO|nr:hypothetical protein [Loigolactobacillus jiayinensis]
MANDNNSSMSRETLRRRKNRQQPAEVNEDEFEQNKTKKNKNKKRRHHRKFWFLVVVLLIILGAIFFWRSSRSELTGSWVEISNTNGTTYTNETDIADLNTLTIKNDKYTYTRNGDLSNSATGAFNDDGNNQANLETETVNYSLSADNDQLTFTSVSGGISRLDNHATVTFVRVNSTAYKQIKAKITAQNEAASASSASQASSESSASSERAASSTDSAAATSSSSNKISSAIAGIKDKITTNSSSSEVDSSSDSSTDAASSATDTAPTDNSNSATDIWNQVQNQVQSWFNDLSNTTN